MDRIKKKQIVLAVCGDKHCKESNSKKLRKRLEELVAELELEDRVIIEKTGCLKHCKEGPVIRISPGKHTLTAVKPKQAEQILQTALDTLQS